MTKEEFELVQKYVGCPYSKMDCADLFLDVQENVFKKSFDIQDEYMRHSKNGASQRHQIQHAIMEYGVALEQPQNACMVLFKPTVRGVWHIGTVIIYADQTWVLHANSASGCAELTRLKDLRIRGYVLEGFYTWKS